ncbi:MAG: hypothetical protein GX628_02925 [Clostridiales bacterium]|nr:hypothetical protein [Clostridiales bacterium]
MEKLKVGLLPLYIKLYDDFSAQMRPRIDLFYEQITEAIRAKGAEVVTSPVCRLTKEFKATVAYFEEAGVDAIVTLHLAYSPSLKSAEVLANTRLPIVVLDTTPTYIYDAYTDPAELSYNHGIHGVQDMCNLLRRNGKFFRIHAGHWEESDVIDRVLASVKGAKLAKKLPSMRVGMVGEPFKGMGDFQLGGRKLNKLLGFTTIDFDMDSQYEISTAEAESEYAYDAVRYDVSALTKDEYLERVKVDLAIRKWVEEQKLDAFTVNFLSTSKDNAMYYMPFTAASKAMRDGIGYAGEGDLMTAALVGTFLSQYNETSFTEMFCPDWKNNSIFLNHMGEQNPNCAVGSRYVTSSFKYTDAGEPMKLVGTFKPGKAIFACLAPQAGNKFTLIASQVEMLDTPADNRHTGGVNGWLKPAKPVSDFLEDYSRNGGIHHAMLVYGGDIEVVKAFAEYSGFGFVEI